MSQDTTEARGVLVVGAGPVGLSMACELLRHGVPCRIIDQNDGPTNQSRALGVQARTLEIFENIGAIGPVLAQGRKLHGLSAFAEGKRIVHLTLDLSEMDTPYPYAIALPQSRTERILLDVLKERGGTVERRARLATFQQDDQGVTATLTDGEGHEQVVRAAWLIGCDGARSVVRHVLNLPFEGAEYEEKFLLADVRLEWGQPDDEIQTVLTPEGPVLAFPLLEEGRWRLVDTSGTVQSDDPVTVVAHFQRQLTANGFPQALVSDPVWVSSFAIHRRVARHFRDGRCFVAGDAAHIHSPAGGQGMNTGIQDAYNLAWKLGLVHAGAARDPDGLLNSFELERRPVAAEVLRGSDWATRVVTLRNPILASLRNRLMHVLPEFDFVRRRLSRGVSELGIGYRNSPIVAEDRAAPTHRPTHPATPFSAGPHPGDRAPDVVFADSEHLGPKRLYEILRGTRHTLILFAGLEPTDDVPSKLAAIGATVRADLGSWINVHIALAATARPENWTWDGALILDPDQALHDRFGADSDCLYLIRPDGYVGYRSQPADGEKLAAYLGNLFVSG